MTGSSNEYTLDRLFEQLESVVPEGYKTEIVGGKAFMWPQRDTHWEITMCLLEQLRTKYARRRLLSDVRVDYPGHLNGFASDVTLISERAERNPHGPVRHEDVEFVAEVISKETAANEYGPKKDAYAAAEVPVYLIVDPYTGRWHLYTQPKDGEYRAGLSFGFGDEIDLTGTVVGLVLKTDEFPRD